MSEHVDTETISAFREDLLPEHQAARVAAHLSSCARCADVDAQLAGVSALLASTPVPPMPATLRARIEAALAAEAAIRAAPAQPAPAQPAPAHPAAGPAISTAGSGPPRRGGPAGSREAAAGRARRRRRLAAWSPGFSGLALRVSAVAATIIVVAGAGYGLARLAASSQSGSTASSASSPEKASGIRGPAPSGAGQPGAPSLAGSLPLVASGTNYQPGQIAAQASAVLRRQLSFRASMPAATAGTPASAFGGLNKVRACVTRVTGGLRPRLVDVASYRGQPALAIIVPTGGGSSRVWVVGAGCSAATSDVLARASIPGGG